VGNYLVEKLVELPLFFIQENDPLVLVAGQYRVSKKAIKGCSDLSVKFQVYISKKDARG